MKYSRLPTTELHQRRWRVHHDVVSSFRRIKTTMTAAAMTPSQAYLDEEKAWDDISAMMNESASNSKALFDGFQAEINNGSALIDDISNEKKSLNNRAEQIRSSINCQIEHETNAFQNESQELATQIRTVQALERALEHESQLSSEMASKEQTIQESIASYQREMAASSSEISDIECAHMKRLGKNRRAISMYAEMTNIKWDYGRADVLAGEVSLPKQMVHRRFCVEKDLGELEIAEKLWEVIEG